MDDNLAWKQISEKTFKGAYKTYLTRNFELPNGSRADYDLTNNKSGFFVGCFALTPVNEVIICEEFKPGPGKVIKNLPFGIGEVGEEPKAGALRELREETGYEPQEFIALNPGGSPVSAYDTSYGHYFLALGCKLKHKQELDEHEFINVITMPLRQYVNEVLRSGKLIHADCAWLAIDYLLRNGLISFNDIAAG